MTKFFEWLREKEREDARAKAATGADAQQPPPHMQWSMPSYEELAESARQQQAYAGGR